MNRTGQQTASKFLTMEQREAIAHGSFAPYWWLDNSLCRRFLVSCAADPATFETRKLLFPFFREGALYGPPHGWWTAPIWMTTAFFAGWFFGRQHPETALANPGCLTREASPQTDRKPQFENVLCLQRVLRFKDSRLAWEW